MGGVAAFGQAIRAKNSRRLFADFRLDPIENLDRVTNFHHVTIPVSLLVQGIADTELVQKFFLPFWRQRRLRDVVGGVGVFRGSPAGARRRGNQGGKDTRKDQ